jgi:hypothetical protein
MVLVQVPSSRTAAGAGHSISSFWTDDRAITNSWYFLRHESGSGFLNALPGNTLLPKVGLPGSKSNVMTKKRGSRSEGVSFSINGEIECPAPLVPCVGPAPIRATAHCQAETRRRYSDGCHHCIGQTVWPLRLPHDRRPPSSYRLASQRQAG